MTLTMQTQLANVLGTVQQIQTQVIRLANQCNDTHSRVTALENLSRHGFEQIGAKVGSAWTSQSKNRKAIEENNATIGEVARDLTEVKGTLRDVVRRMEPGAIVAHQVQDPWGRTVPVQRPVDAQVQPAPRPVMVPNVQPLFVRPADPQAVTPRPPQQAMAPRAPRPDRPERPIGPVRDFNIIILLYAIFFADLPVLSGIPQGPSLPRLSNVAIQTPYALGALRLLPVSQDQRLSQRTS